MSETTSVVTNSSSDEAITMGIHANEKRICAECGSEGTAETFFSYQGKDGKDVYLCEGCRTKINAAIDGEEKNVHMGGAMGLGILASIVGGVIWYYFTTITGREFGYIALGLGYLVGYAVYLGAGKNRSHKLQVIAGILTLATIFIAEWFMYNHFLNDYVLQNPDVRPDWLSPGESISVSLFDTDFLSSLLSPIGLLIYALGAYVAYHFPKPQKI
jgi:hypothetical protein